MVAANSHICAEDNSQEIYRLLRNAGRESLKAFQSFLDPPHQLSLTKIRALMYLEQHLGGTGSVGELAKGLVLTLGWASRIAEALAWDGLVDCVRDKRDRRLVHVKLTEKGVSTACVLSASLKGPVVTALGEMQPEQRKVIRKFLQRFTTELNRQAKETAQESPNSR
jgi:DNA-binding MarR family transcriptional regulator